jgi:hypothetical protein
MNDRSVRSPGASHARVSDPMTDLAGRYAACDLAQWFPRLVATGVPVPETRIIRTGLELQCLLDDGEPDLALDEVGAFCDEIASAVQVVGGPPAFLRTGHLSGKHRWRETCHVVKDDRDTVLAHVRALVEESVLAGILGLPTDTWAVRRLLELDSAFTAFEGLPVAFERRVFIAEGRVVCDHPYWPAEAVARGAPSSRTWRAQLQAMDAAWPTFAPSVLEHAAMVAQAFEDAWSLDFARAKDGTWYAIDMARAELSFHWKGCPENRWVS